MSIIRQLTEAEQDQAWRDSLILRVAEAVHYAVSTMASVNDEFWNTLEPQRLVAMLNADIPANLSAMQGNSEIGSVANTWLDKLGLSQFSNRAPLTMGRTDIIFDGRQFVYVAPPADPAPAE